MKECLTDPVTFDPLDDPVTIDSGHTYNRRTLMELAFRSTERYAIKCPMSNTWTRTGMSSDKSIITTYMMEMYHSLKAELESIEHNPFVAPPSNGPTSVDQVEPFSP